MVIKVSNWTRKVQSASSVATGLLLVTLMVDAQTTRPLRVEIFGSVCSSNIATVDGSPFVEAKFAPVRRLGQGEQPRYGTWSYTFETDNQSYPDNRYVLNDDTDDKVQFVSILRPPNSAVDLPPYLWHVISVPSEFLENQENKMTGFVARYKDFYDSEDTAWERTDYLKLINSTAETGDGNIVLAYVGGEGLGEDIVREITSIWTDTFKDAMRELVIESYTSENLSHYTHTFYYQDAPQTAAIINMEAGDRRNSSRRVQKPGMAFGFVLDDTGNCLAWNKLELVVR